MDRFIDRTIEILTWCGIALAGLVGGFLGLLVILGGFILAYSPFIIALVVAAGLIKWLFF